MKSAGCKMYERWQEAMKAQGVGTDDWCELEESDREAWELLATQYDEVRP